MKIVINGEEHSVEQGVTIAAVIEQLGLGGRRLAVEIDRRIVPRATFGERVVAEGERIEIVHAIGGG